MPKHWLQFKITLCILPFTAGICAQSQSTNSLDPGPWPTPAHDNQRTNRSHLQGPFLPGTPTLLYDAGSPVNLDYLAVTSDGKLMLSGCTNQVTAIHADGSPVGASWPYSLLQTSYPGHPETPWGGVTVSAAGRVYVASHECPDISGGVPAHFYSIEGNGTSTPNWPVGARAMYWAPAIASDGTIFQMDEFNFLNAYRPNGSLAWAVHLTGFGNAAIALDYADNLYVGTDGNTYGGHALYSLNSAGVVRPGWPQDPGGIADTTPVIDASGGMYIANLAGALFSFNSDGSKRVGFPFQSGGTVSQFPLALSGLGTIYMKTSLGLFAINPNGTKGWSAPFAPGGDATLSPSPIVDKDGAIYVAFGNAVYSLNPDGSTRQGWPVLIPSAGYMAIGGDGILYVISAGQKLYAVKTSSTKPILTVSATDASRVYGAVNPVLSYTISGFVNGDTQASATSGIPTLSTTATAASSPGAYPIMIARGTLASAKYTFNFADGTLTVTQGLVPTGVAVLDPVPSLLFGREITSIRADLASKGRIVQGIAADGVSEVVLRIPVFHVGDKVTATLLSDRCTDPSNRSTCVASTSSDEDGGLFNPGVAVTSGQSLPNSVSDTTKDTVSYAFLAYRAPADFARAFTPADAGAASRIVYINLAYSSGGVPYGSQTVSLAILRAPVVLVHGYSAGPEAWKVFKPLIADTNRFSLFPVNYGLPLYTVTVNPDDSLTYNISGKVGYDIQSTSPAVNIDAIHQLRESDLGFSWNAPDVHEQILSWISTFTLGHNALGVPVAGVSADVVAHSMGGLVVRYLTTFPGFLPDSPYSQGYIHKLITLGTPHFGTPAAILSVLTNTSCTRSVLAAHNNINITGATSTTSVFLPGAVGEMEGDGIGLSMSNALTTIKAKSIAIPMATLAGDVTSLESNVNNAPVSQLLNACGSDYGDLLGTRFTTSGFESIFDPDITPSNPLGGAGGRKSDGVVPLTSALMNPLATTCSSNQCFPGYTHSGGSRIFFGSLFDPLGSSVDYLQDSSLNVSEQVELLLNTSIRNLVFWGP